MSDVRLIPECYVLLLLATLVVCVLAASEVEQLVEGHLVLGVELKRHNLGREVLYRDSVVNVHLRDQVHVVVFETERGEPHSI